MSTNHRRKDFTQNAIDVVQQTTEEGSTTYRRPEKNQAAVALGRLGGKARAKKLTEQERKDAARKAVTKRWETTKQEQSSRQVDSSSKRPKRRGVIRVPEA